MRWSVWPAVALGVVLLAGCFGGAPPDKAPRDAATGLHILPVVVATIDSGVNPFHPCFRRGIGEDAVFLLERRGLDGEVLQLTFLDTYEASLEASQPALDAMQAETLYAVAGTNLLFFGFNDNAGDEFIDDAGGSLLPIEDYHGFGGTSLGHGAMGASQIGCAEFGAAPEAFVLELDEPQGNSEADTVGAYGDYGLALQEVYRWVLQQPWIDILHSNTTDDIGLCRLVQNVDQMLDETQALIERGTIMVNPVGNERYPDETHCMHNVAGLLLVGANDNDGYSTGPAKDPHVVMDGVMTFGAAADSFDQSYFSLTSSSSPRTAGYVAHLLSLIRQAAEVTETVPGMVATWQSDAPVSTTGPFADGNLTLFELHEVIRKTANPNPHASRFDGESACTPEGRIKWGIMLGWYDVICVPQPTDLPYANYPFMGYGEVSEHTWDHALDVAFGRAPMPERPIEDQAFQASNQARGVDWPG